MKVLKVFETYTKFPISDDNVTEIIRIKKSVNNLYSLMDTKKINQTKSESVEQKYDELKFRDFFFKISSDYITFFKDLGVLDVDSYVFPNPFFDCDVLEFELFFIVEEIGDDFFVINDEKISEFTSDWEYSSIKSYIESLAISVEYLLENAISKNEYAFKEYIDGYSPIFEKLAKLKLKELKK